jgi:energy-coupling factor transport system ATP-binding protein
MNIAISNVVFDYPTGVRALDGVTLSIAAGERVAIIGQNGSGKTTLAKHLNGLLRPTVGTVEVGGWDTRKHTVAQLARRVGFVFQNPTEQIFKSRVADEVGFGPRNLGLAPAAIAERVQSALERTGLSSVRDIHPYDLLPAQRKWVAIASVLAMDPAVYVLDEPTMGQDAHGLARLGGLIETLASAGGTVVTISHDIDFCAEHFARIVVMSQGRVLADGDRHTVFAQADLLAQTYVEPPQMTRLASALNLAQTATTVSEFLEALRNPT